MLDTIKVGVPLTKSQFQRIHHSSSLEAKPQWVLYFPDTGEMLLRKVSGLASADQNSFHREIRWDIPVSYRQGNTYLILELSLPKLYYGHNIHLLYDFTKALDLLKQMLETQFELRGRAKLIEVCQWRLWRVDVCYAWRCPSQVIAQKLLDSLKHLHFPRKRPVIYPTSILFAGAIYSLKFYLKLPEFKEHDRKALLKAKAPLNWVNHCELLATGVLRVEATLRHKYLKKKQINTVGDLLTPVTEFWFEKEGYPDGFDFDLAFHAICYYYMTDVVQSGDWVLRDGERYNAPEGYELRGVASSGEEFTYQHIGNGFVFKKFDRATSILQYLLSKYFGENPGMQHTDEVEAKLNAVFKPGKAARLMGIWLYVQRFGTQRAKEAFGNNSYYAAKRDMKKAAVSLIELPSNVVRLEYEFWKKFKVEIPSKDYVVNQFDDFRDSGNILNMPFTQDEQVNSR